MQNPFHRAAGAVRPPEDVVSPTPAPRLATVHAPPVFREWCGFDEDFVERNRSSRNPAWICNEMLARALVAPGVDPGDRRAEIHALPVAERDRLLIELRRRSLGPRLDLVSDCPSCGVRCEAKVSLADIVVPPQGAPTRIECTLEGGEAVVDRKSVV